MNSKGLVYKRDTRRCVGVCACLCVYVCPCVWNNCYERRQLGEVGRSSSDYITILQLRSVNWNDMYSTQLNLDEEPGRFGPRELGPTCNCSVLSKSRCYWYCR